MQGLQSAVLLLLFLAVCGHVGIITAEKTCQYTSVPGRCKENRRKFYFDSEWGHCRNAYYKACGGNGTLFGNMQACEATCVNREVCSQPLDPAKCPEPSRNIERYFYNSTSETCEKFNFSVCGGNGNRFPMKTACQAVCMTEKVCQQPPEPAPCKPFTAQKSYSHQTYYNNRTGRCETFMYGGCGGNDNRFYSEYGCQRMCFNKENMCNQRPDPGACNYHYPRYSYNTTTAKCEPFLYKGCGGNGNLFGTLEECQFICTW